MSNTDYVPLFPILNSKYKYHHSTFIVKHIRNNLKHIRLIEACGAKRPLLIHKDDLTLISDVADSLLINQSRIYIFKVRIESPATSVERDLRQKSPPGLTLLKIGYTNSLYRREHDMPKEVKRMLRGTNFNLSFIKLLGSIPGSLKDEHSIHQGIPPSYKFRGDEWYKEVVSIYLQDPGVKDLTTKRLLTSLASIVN